MLRERTYGYLLNAKALREHALRLKKFHEETGTGDVSSVQALAELRKDVTEQLAETASTSRLSNRKRTRARSLAVYFLMLSMALAFLTSALIFVEDKVQSITTEGKADNGSGTNATTSVADPPGAANKAQPTAAGIRTGGSGPTFQNTTAPELNFGTSSEATQRKPQNTSR